MRSFLSFLSAIFFFTSLPAWAMDYQIDVLKVEAQKILVIHSVVKPEEVSNELAKDIPLVADYIKKHNIAASNTPLAHYLQYEPPKPVEMETGYAVAGVNAGEGDIVLRDLPAGRAAVTMHIGPYETSGAAYQAIHAWMDKSGEKPGGAPWEVYLNSPTQVAPAALKTVIYYPLK